MFVFRDVRENRHDKPCVGFSGKQQKGKPLPRTAVIASNVWKFGCLCFFVHFPDVSQKRRSLLCLWPASGKQIRL